MYHCCHGPEDLSNQQAKAQPKKDKERLKKVEFGLSVKRGCQAQFVVLQLAADPDVAEIRYYQAEHCNHPDGSVRLWHISPQLQSPMSKM